MSEALENVRRRLARAIRYVSDAGNFDNGKPDPDKTARAVYTIIINDVPGLLQTVEAYKLVVKEQREYIEQLERKLRGD